jgi:SGT1 protein
MLRYPNNLSHHVHNAKAYLPVDIAKALSINPTLVQKAAETFYTRDGTQLRVRIGSHVVLHPLTEHPGSTQDESLSSTATSSADHSADTNRLCTVGRSEVLPAKSIWTLARKRRDSGVEMEGSGPQNSKCCVLWSIPLHCKSHVVLRF